MLFLTAVFMNISEVAAVCKAKGVHVHLDGARLWNAHVATGLPFETLCEHADSVSLCLSKGLAAPVGSILVGTMRYGYRSGKCSRWLAFRSS